MFEVSEEQLSKWCASIRGGLRGKNLTPSERLRLNESKEEIELALISLKAKKTKERLRNGKTKKYC